MSIRPSCSRWFFYGVLFQLVGCGSDNGGSLSAGVGGTNSTNTQNGGDTAIGQGGAKAAGGAISTSSGGVQALGGSGSIVGGALSGGATGVGNASSGGVGTGGNSNLGGTSAGGAAAGGKASLGGSTSSGGASVGGAAVGGKAATGGNASSGGSAAGGKASTGGSATGTGGVTVATGGKAATGGSSSTTVGTGAPETKPLGYGQATTGGGNATPTNVSSFAAAQAAIDAYSGTGGLVLNYTGKFDFASITDPCTQRTAEAQILEIKNKSNISILGADGSSAHFGIHIAAASSNIIVRNMTIGLTAGGDASDMISIEGMSGGIPKDIWIDHNTLWSSMVECTGAGDLEFDGMIDVKKGADNVTVSYNYLHDHHKVSLNGFSDSDTAVRHITFHHNLFENVSSRTPLQRGGYSHMLNNYFSKVLVSGINVRMDGYSLVESNYFESVVNPVTSRDSDAIGYWDLRNNNLATKADVSAGNAYGITWTSGNTGTVNATEWATTKPFPVALGYSYTADPWKCVHDGLRASVGAGKGLVTLKCN